MFPLIEALGAGPVNVSGVEGGQGDDADAARLGRSSPLVNCTLIARRPSANECVAYAELALIRGSHALSGVTAGGRWLVVLLSPLLSDLTSPQQGRPDREWFYGEMAVA